MKKWCFLLFLVSIGFTSCSSSKSVIKNTSKSSNKIDRIVANALKFQGVRYKYGGTTKRGMDCSGMVYVSCLQENVHVPRISRNMAKKGMKVSLKKAKKGDFLFFKTSRRNPRINHVGLIVSVNKNQIRFIHSTTSRGVIISSLSEKYWKNAFVKVNRIL